MSGRELLDADAETSQIPGSDLPGGGVDATASGLRPTVEFVRDRYEAGDRFLAIGCGDGAFLEDVASNCPGLSCTGVAIAPRPVPDRQRSEAEYLRADAGQLPLQERSYRFIHFDGVLRQFAGRDRGRSKRAVISALSDAKDCLREDGWVLVSERSPRGRHLPDRLLASCIFTASKYGSYPRSLIDSRVTPGHPSRSVYTRPELRGMLAMAGFQVHDVDVHRNCERAGPPGFLERVTQRLTLYASPR